MQGPTTTEAMTEKQKAYQERQKFRKRLAEFKQSKGCADCGETNPIVLDFDHLRDKKYNVSQMVHDGFSWVAIEKEMKKCEVVCANCHRIRTHNRKMI